MDRRHDLDALRAIAMLLGIVLHAALSFLPFGWMVTDQNTHPNYGVLVESIHGFRMPLFFLLSGFFTAMLWRKRGLGALLLHRFKRIFMPLLLGMFTIIPLTFWVNNFVASNKKTGSISESQQDGDFWKAVFDGDLETLKTSAQQEWFDPNVIGPDGNATMLASAAFLGHDEVVEFLIKSGADVNKRNVDQGTALHGAAFLGRARVAKLLIDSGADVHAKNREGKTAYEALQYDWGTTSFVANMFEVEISQDEVIQGRKKIGEMLLAEDAEQLGDHENMSQSGSIADLVNLLFYFPLMNHLWFLWFLCIFVFGFVFYSFLIEKLRVATWLPNALVATPFCLLWLIPLTILPQAFMDPNAFGPDTSIGILPLPAPLLYYAIFFFFGALYWDYNDQKGRLFFGWWLLLIIGGAIFPLAMRIREQYGSGGEHLKLVFNVLQAFYVWFLSLGLMGLFHRFFAKESKTMRYISDSSYWLYVAHLPLVIYAQWWVSDWQVPSFVKFSGICVVITAFLLVIYEYCVRYTPIGTLLNGKRVRQRREPVVVQAELAAATNAED